jgi:hypothetical protein
MPAPLYKFMLPQEAYRTEAMFGILSGLSTLCSAMPTMNRLIFVVPPDEFEYMKEQPLVTVAKAPMDPDRIHAKVKNVQHFVMALPMASGT